MNYSWGAAGAWDGEKHGKIYNGDDGDNDYFDDRNICGYDCGGLMTYITAPTGERLEDGTFNQFPQLGDEGLLPGDDILRKTQELIIKEYSHRLKYIITCCEKFYHWIHEIKKQDMA